MLYKISKYFPMFVILVVVALISYGEYDRAFIDEYGSHAFYMWQIFIIVALIISTFPLMAIVGRALIDRNWTISVISIATMMLVTTYIFPPRVILLYSYWLRTFVVEMIEGPKNEGPVYVYANYPTFRFVIADNSGSLMGDSKKWPESLRQILLNSGIYRSAIDCTRLDIQHLRRNYYYLSVVCE